MYLMPLKQLNEAIDNVTELPLGFYVRPEPEDRVETRVTSEALTVFEFLPIAAEHKFELLHLTPVPAMQNGTFFVQRLTSRTVALNYDQVIR